MVSLCCFTTLRLLSEYLFGSCCDGNDTCHQFKMRGSKIPIPEGLTKFCISWKIYLRSRSEFSAHKPCRVLVVNVLPYFRSTHCTYSTDLQITNIISWISTNCTVVSVAICRRTLYNNWIFFYYRFIKINNFLGTNNNNFKIFDPIYFDIPCVCIAMRIRNIIVFLNIMYQANKLKKFI